MLLSWGLSDKDLGGLSSGLPVGELHLHALGFCKALVQPHNIQQLSVTQGHFISSRAGSRYELSKITLKHFSFYQIQLNWTEACPHGVVSCTRVGCTPQTILQVLLSDRRTAGTVVVVCYLYIVTAIQTEVSLLSIPVQFNSTFSSIKRFWLHT